MIGQLYNLGDRFTSWGWRAAEATAPHVDGEEWWRNETDAFDADAFAAARAKKPQLTIRVGPSQRPLRLLAIHGRGANNDITSIQMMGSGISACVQVDLLAAPYGEEPAWAAYERISKRPFRTWWNTSATADQFEKAMRGILKLIEANGPYDGLYGFSQGSAIVSFLSAPGAAEALGGTRSWRFVIAAGGVSMGAPQARELLTRARTEKGIKIADGPPALGPIELPSLHIIGRKDFCRPMSNELAAFYDSPVFVHHEHGHELPLSLKSDVAFQDAVHGFLRAQAAAAP